jgi:hypothetical protein
MMLRRFHKQGMMTVLLTAVLVLLVSISSVSCSKSSLSDTLPRKYSTVLLKVSSGQQETVKAALSEQEESQLHSLRIYAFSKGRLAGYHYQPSSVDKDFLFDIEMVGVDQETGKVVVDFYIVANEASMVLEPGAPALSEASSEDDLRSFRFQALNTHYGLPLFYADTVILNTKDFRTAESLAEEGVDISGHEGHEVLTRALSFELKRAIGKINVSARRFSESTRDVYINRCDYLACGTRQYNYLMPQSPDFLQTLSPLLNDMPLMDEGVTQVVTQTSYEQIGQIYCPEVPFGSAQWDVPSTGNAPILHLEYSVGEGEMLRNTYIYLPPIERNQFVDVQCSISGEGQLKVNYEVRDWDYEMEDEDEDGQEDFIVFDYPTHTYLLPSLPTPENPSPNPNGAVKLTPQMSVDEPFVCYFQMLYPEGQKWKPTIVSSDVPVHDYKIKVFLNNLDTEQLPDESGSYGLSPNASTYFRLEVHPLKAENVGATLQFGITSDIQGFDYAEYLLINGSMSELFWPAETGGTDPSSLTIKQIE